MITLTMVIILEVTLSYAKESEIQEKVVAKLHIDKWTI